MNQANSVPAFLTLRVFQEKLRMQKGTCHGLHRKFFRSRVLHLPGNNYAWMCAKSLQSCPTLRPYGLKPARLLCPWDSPGKNTVDCHTHFQGIFLTQGSNPGFLHLLALAGGFFTTSASWEAQIRYSCGQESPPSE